MERDDRGRAYHGTPSRRQGAGPAIRFSRFRGFDYRCKAVNLGLSYYQTVSFCLALKLST